MKISELVSDLSYKEIKERQWRICRFFKKGKEIKILEFAVSSKGEVMRILSPKVKGRAYLGKVCKFNNYSNYIHGTFRKNRRSYRIRLHKLVMESFIGKCPDGKEVNHKDGKKHNNNLKNLEYITRSENKKHAYRLGLQPKVGVALYEIGENHPNSKLSQKEVDKIRKLWESRKFTQEQLGKRYGVSKSCISHIVKWHTFNPKGIKYVSKFERGGTGEKNSNSKLTIKKVLKIRKIYKLFNCSFISLAKKFRVSDRTISNIIRGKSWKFV